MLINIFMYKQNKKTMTKQLIKFIRAEVISFADYVECNGEQGAKEAGKMRVEGKDYEVQDGDVVLFRFNV